MSKSKGEMIVLTAKSQLGTTESPENSNRTIYGRWFGLDGMAWCGIFVSWCYWMAGYRLPNIGYVKGFAGCQTAVKYFKDNGKVVKNPEKGDIVFYDWNNDGRYDHTGIFDCWEDETKKFFWAYEGNTSIGNDSNGGVVMRRKRNVSVSIFVRP